jgi:ATP-dependent Clp protease, protease subunit
MTTIEILGPIGAGFVTASDVSARLASAPSGPLLVTINSPGGDVFEGLAIYNLLRARADVTVRIIGLAASAASYIALAGSRVEMAEGAMMMVHAAHSSGNGTADSLREEANLLDKITGQMANIYATRTGKSSAEVADWLREDTWFDAKEAKAAGLIDEIIGGEQIQAFATAWRFNKAPAAIAAKFDVEAVHRAQVEQLKTELAKARRDAVAARIDGELTGCHAVSPEAKAALVDTYLTNEASGRAMLAAVKRPKAPPGVAPIAHFGGSPSDHDFEHSYKSYMQKIPKR